jgi:hypothetical protein
MDVMSRSSGTRTQHAIRLLVLLDECGEPVDDQVIPQGCDQVIPQV